MPIFEYICRGCDHQFETIVLGSQRPSCPRCGGGRLEKRLSAFAVGRGDGGPNATPPVPAACGSCGDPRGPGACGRG